MSGEIKWSEKDVREFNEAINSLRKAIMRDHDIFAAEDAFESLDRFLPFPPLEAGLGEVKLRGEVS